MSDVDLFGECVVDVPGARLGRPPGRAVKRVTREYVELLVAQGVKPPLVILAEMYSEGTDEKATRLGIGKASAEALRMEAAKAAAKIWHPNQAQEVELPDGRQAVLMPVIIGGQFAAHDGGQLKAIDPPPEIAERLKQLRQRSEQAPKRPPIDVESEEI